MVSLLLDSVTKSYPSGDALVNLSLRVEDGESIVLLGPSGSGKTTVLRLLAGLEKPSSGDILFDGSRVNEVAPNERNVAMVFQNHVLYPFLDVRGNLGFPLVSQKMRREERSSRIEAEARVLGLEGQLSKKPAALSSGHKQLAQVAKAMVSNPDLFLIDEAFEQIDLGMRKTLRTELRLLQQGYGVTAVYATHDQEDAMVLGDRLAVMDQGRIRQAGPPLELYHRPDDVFVAGFLGSPPMSLLAATTPGGRVVLDDFAPDLPPGLPRRVLVGARPESWRSTAGGISGQVEQVLFLGDASLVRVATAHGPLTARVRGELPEVGTTINLEPVRFSVFDAQSGKALHHFTG